MLGLLVIHLLLLAVHKLHPDLGGQVALYSDCLGALGKVADLPQSGLPSSMKHAYILMILMIHCQEFSFDVSYRHVRAHQDNRVHYSNLPRPAQLNCQMDFLVKKVLWGLEGLRPPPQGMLPLESVGVFAGKRKITSGPGKTLWFWSSCMVARLVFVKYHILTPEDFGKVAWYVVHSAL
jgi:hypothetical protein